MPSLTRRVVAASLALLVPAAGWADSCPQARPMPEGVPAPCTGVLIPPVMAAECIKLKRSLLPVAEAKLRECGELLELEKEGRARDEKALRDLLAVKPRQPSCVGVSVSTAAWLSGGALVLGVVAGVLLRGRFEDTRSR